QYLDVGVAQIKISVDPLDYVVKSYHVASGEVILPYPLRRPRILAPGRFYDCRKAVEGLVERVVNNNIIIVVYLFHLPFRLGEAFLEIPGLFAPPFGEPSLENPERRREDETKHPGPVFL